ncbi:hypothetical protein BO99DRAFT_209088 [Aspergillus violaceofuscus CBS 115571]|uniref:Uncharacterized protein n=1 Tax=Aspergillus violaceofuscus (strain CBS 115571) TaxID=1450538 RepID=A0A2V5H0H1_ASPV1|nr:hypothetical protein BO99DRAFT_209088 [Aspergillus violaceofuscus CBS 115571]
MSVVLQYAAMKCILIRAMQYYGLKQLDRIPRSGDRMVISRWLMIELAVGLAFSVTVNLVTSKTQYTSGIEMVRQATVPVQEFRD